MADSNDRPIGFIGKRLKELRVSNNYTVEQMANLLGVSVRAYRSYEKRERDPSTLNVAKLVICFGVSADYLIGVTDDPNLNQKRPPVDLDDLRQKITQSTQKLKTEQSLEAILSHIEYLIDKESRGK